jgi:hypothetical protein
MLPATTSLMAAYFDSNVTLETKPARYLAEPTVVQVTSIWKTKPFKRASVDLFGTCSEFDGLVNFHHVFFNPDKGNIS